MGNMSRLVLALAIAFLPAAAGADPGKGKGHDKHRGKAAHPVVIDAQGRGDWGGERG